MASDNQPQEIHLPRDVLASEQPPVKDGKVTTRKRGRPPIAVTDEVLERRRLSRLRVNASRPRGADGQGPPRRRGRPPIVMTQEVLEQRRVSRQRVNAQRPQKPKSNGMVNVIQASNNNQSTSSSQDTGATQPVEESKTPSPASTDVVDRKGESRRLRNSIDRKKRDFMVNNTILHLGRQEETCGFCKAMVWAAEFTGRHVGMGPKGYSICCGKGKVQLPLLRETPRELGALLNSTGVRSTGYFNKSRVYNNIFSFCSFGGNVDHSVNNGKAPFVFRVSGRIYHSLGSLVPPDGLSPKFAQLYMYDPQEAMGQRVNFPGKAGEVDPVIVALLQEMLERDNVLVGVFKQLRERFTGLNPEPVGLRLLERRRTDGRFENLLTAADYKFENLPPANDYEFAALVVDNDFVNCRDVVAEHKRNGLQHISELHPSYMSLQYPLLFPHGEDGYRTNIKHRNVSDTDNQRHNTVSMREYYAFRAHFRVGEGHTLLRGGRLFLQFVVDAWCAVERARLTWVQTHQSIIRSDHIPTQTSMTHI